MRKKKIWRLPAIEAKQQGIFAEKLGVVRPIAQVLLNRGLSSPEQAAYFLQAGIEQLRDPLEIPGMKSGAERIVRALTNEEKILIYGDYDVDGITATALLTVFLRNRKGKVSYYIPDRLEEGYGLNPQALQQAKANGTGLIITVDCGISALQEADFARKIGLDLVITDHHQPPPELPQAVAVINPKLAPGEHPWSVLAGVGVAFKLAQAVCKLQGEEHHCEELLDLVALGTVADIVPLREENRILVKEGLKRITALKRPGVQALLNVAGLKTEQISAGQVGFVLAPRLNACGRLSQADTGVELLLTEDAEQAEKLARLLDQENKNRQALETGILNEALELMGQKNDPARDRVIVLASANWHPGVIGIVASRLVEKFYRPAIMISIEDGVGKGSARSIAGFNLYQALQHVEGLLLKFGGHEMAAGLSIREENIPELKAALNKYAHEVMSEKDLLPSLQVDCDIFPAEINPALIEDMEKLAPFGYQNPAPVFVLRDRVVSNWRQIGNNNNHLKLRVLAGKDNWLDAVVFQAGGLKEEACTLERCDLAFIPEMNTWQGRSQVQLIVKDLKSSAEPDDPTQPLSFLDRLYSDGEIWLEDDYYRDIADREKFFTKLVGVTYEDRQQVLGRIPDGEALELRREKDNIYDKQAIAVFWQGQQIGYLNARLTRNLAPAIDSGALYKAYLTKVTGRERGLLGANICVQRVEKDKTVIEYEQLKLPLSWLSEEELLETIRRAVLGEYSYHEKQREAIAALQAGENSLVILATGRGKSAIFQTVAAQLAITRKQAAIIVYPLRSLVNDQYRHLQTKLGPLGIDVQAVNGSLNTEEKKDFFKRWLNGQGDIILTTPEFLEFHWEKFQSMAQRIGLFVVDESHHLAQGKRRGYRSLPRIWRKLGKPLALAVTATADKNTARLISEYLECKRLIVEKHIRTNLQLVDRRGEKDKLLYLLDLIAREEKTVIYVNSRKQAYQLARDLRYYYPPGRERIGFYHGGLNSELRVTLEEMFRRGELQVMVSTSAFGEGINIDDIKNVVLYHLCFSATEFNQLAGRAGRNNQEAYIHILFGEQDRKLNEFILSGVAPSRDVLIRVYLYLREQARAQNPLQVTNNEIQEAMQRQGLKHFREQTASACLAIFEELGLLLREINGNRRYIHFIAPPPGKMELTDSLRYQEGLSEWQEFKEFADYILQAEEDSIISGFNRPICPGTEEGLG